MNGINDCLSFYMRILDLIYNQIINRMDGWWMAVFSLFSVERIFSFSPAMQLCLKNCCTTVIDFHLTIKLYIRSNLKMISIEMLQLQCERGAWSQRKSNPFNKNQIKRSFYEMLMCQSFVMLFYCIDWPIQN